MGQGYIRNDTTNQIANGNNIDADALDGEFDSVVSAFNSVSGHTHDGTTGEGGPVSVIGPAQDIVVSTDSVLPKTTATVDLGSTVKKFKNVHVSGSVTAPTFVGGLTGNVTGDVTGSLTGAVEASVINVTSGSPLIRLTENDSIFVDSSWYVIQSGNNNVQYWFNGTEAKILARQRFDESGAIDHGFWVGGVSAAVIVAAGTDAPGGTTVMTREKADARFTPIEHVGSTGAAHGNVTTSVAGFMSAADKVKLNGIADAAPTVSAGTGITVTTGAGPSVTIAHSDTSSQSSVNNIGGNVVQDITLDTFGHITAIVSENLDDRYLRNSGGELFAGINFGSSTVATREDLSRHIALWGTNYGFSVSAASLNIVTPSAGSATFVRDGVVTARVDPSGTSTVDANTVMTREKSDFRFYLKSEIDSALSLLAAKSANLSDLQSVTTARTNLGLGTLATQDEGTGGTQFRDNAANDLRFAAIADAYPGIYTGSSAGNTVFPIGETIVVDTGGTLARNATATVRLDTVATRGYTTSGAGTILTGTWRSRGEMSGGFTLMVRVA